jgi:hypothetical protein
MKSLKQGSKDRIKLGMRAGKLRHLLHEAYTLGQTVAQLGVVGEDANTQARYAVVGYLQAKVYGEPAAELNFAQLFVYGANPLLAAPYGQGLKEHSIGDVYKELTEGPLKSLLDFKPRAGEGFGLDTELGRPGLSLATGAELDYYGAKAKLPRNTEEPDDSYRARIQKQEGTFFVWSDHAAGQYFDKLRTFSREEWLEQYTQTPRPTREVVIEQLLPIIKCSREFLHHQTDKQLLTLAKEYKIDKGLVNALRRQVDEAPWPRNPDGTPVVECNATFATPPRPFLNPVLIPEAERRSMAPAVCNLSGARHTWKEIEGNRLRCSCGYIIYGPYDKLPEWLRNAD